jgi:integrase
MFAQGVPVPVVQETLGHATQAQTVDTYLHLLPDERRSAAHKVWDWLGTPVDD